MADVDINMYKLLEINDWRYVKTAPTPLANDQSRTGCPKNELGVLAHQVSRCEKCALSRGRTQTVFGTGAPDASLLIVGEAPGMHEDKRGEPFVGRAGLLLNQMLAAIGLDREAVYIANILKCRPPNNRDPSTQEILACMPYLHQQIALIQPKVILALGRHAAHNLLDMETPLGRMRQKWHSFQDIPLIVSYHPAYLLRNPADKARAWEDLRLLKARFDAWVSPS